jgi:predicted phosphodiesterase
VRIAALYDVHGMPWALEAVLRELDDEGVRLVLYGGDLLDGPFPDLAYELARSVEFSFVRGNCERVPSDWDRKLLSEDDLWFLAQQPLTQSFDGVLYCHAAPDDDMPITTVFTPDEVIAERFGGCEERTIVIGHTHQQFDRHVGDLRVVNAGSVGMPYEGEVAAFWTLVVDGEPQFRKTPFDVGQAIAEIESSGWPQAEAFIAENLRTAVTREEAIAAFQGHGE